MADADWKRLAGYVIARRVELGYQHRKVFAAEIHVSDRTLSKLEAGVPVSRNTLATVENCLGWQPGSADRILEGGEPTLVGLEPVPVALPATGPSADPAAFTEDHFFAMIQAGTEPPYPPRGIRNPEERIIWALDVTAEMRWAAIKGMRDAAAALDTVQSTAQPNSDTNSGNTQWGRRAR